VQIKLIAIAYGKNIYLKKDYYDEMSLTTNEHKKLSPNVKKNCLRYS